ncbi:hypothetical protein PVA17_18550 [Lysinibacillus sp. CNPSo 3705]|uniref:hypothetical protein n=1 Tax=Lysinibacillus sp. CNPSo 3705 TaxID=3028148 RepID=UPI002363645D|nr:hypothetical protein [Lysinibacillus sp. CNPSo 3705]MDD1504747.1 hypothetical protein [Lysinibacillus sp. CNPSo 3705]
MRQSTARKPSSQSFERSYIKSYVKLLTQQAANTAQKVENYFFAEDGSEDELKTWYCVATAFYVAAIVFVFVAIN